jgi:hypothetical protein
MRQVIALPLANAHVHSVPALAIRQRAVSDVDCSNEVGGTGSCDGCMRCLPSAVSSLQTRSQFNCGATALQM